MPVVRKKGHSLLLKSGKKILLFQILDKKLASILGGTFFVIPVECSD
jgi:hypothetical protein